MTPKIGIVPDQVKGAWVWYSRPGLVDDLKASGHNCLLIKGGIDGGGQQEGGALWDQWNATDMQAARDAGVEPYLFAYSYLGGLGGIDHEVALLKMLCQRWLPHRIVLNYEVETDGVSAEQVDRFFDTLESAMSELAGDNAPANDNSSVPSWNGGAAGGSRYHNVPYEAVSARTAIDWYQNYWDQDDGVTYDWQDGYQKQRGATFAGKLVIPSFTVPKSPEAFAAWAQSRGYPGIAGWEAGNAAYSFRSVAQAWPLIQAHIEGIVAKTQAQIDEGIAAGNCWTAFNTDRLADPKRNGLPLWEGVIDLSQYGFGQARYLKVEKGCVWSNGAVTDWLHDGQYDQLKAAGKVVAEFR